MDHRHTGFASTVNLNSVFFDILAYANMTAHCQSFRAESMTSFFFPSSGPGIPTEEKQNIPLRGANGSIHRFCNWLGAGGERTALPLENVRHMYIS